MRLHPEGFAMSYEEEQIDTKDKYAARFASAQSMWIFGTFYQGQLVGTVTLIQETLQKLKHRANVLISALKWTDTYADEEKMGLFLSSFGGDTSGTTDHAHHISNRTK
ncbi:hypothetical protein C6345_07690 [Bacillus sp. LNXM12-2]|nr:hypothetical protein C6Y07_05180 [Bacillus sp. LNXM12-1]PSB75621.1 hypothetical protein C6345_07690 [Bacillus sp. LNXM12-2]